MNEVSERMIQLAKKLKALADRGVDGEKENAITMLQSLMTKHKITMEMITGDETKDHEFIILNDKFSAKFFCQIVASVMGKNKKMGFYVKHPRGKDRLFVNCTPSEAIEIQAKFDFFYNVYQKEVDIFYEAFIQTNHLWRKESGDDKDKTDKKELTPEEKEKLYRMDNMMAGMERHVFTKQIGYTKNK